MNISIFTFVVLGGFTVLGIQAAHNTIQICPPGYRYHDNVNTCLRIYRDEAQSWNKARRQCHADGGGDLVIARDHETNEIIREMLTNQDEVLWVGLRQDEDFPRRYRWVDDSLVVYARWTGGHPPIDPEYVPNCVGFFNTFGVSTNQEWAHLSCSSHLPFVCEKRPGAFLLCPPGYTTYHLGRKCVKVVYHRELSWDNARTECQRDQGDLVIISDAAYNSFVTHLLPHVAEYHIGLRNIPEGSHSHVFKWVDGSVLDYNRWRYGEPNYQGLSQGYRNTDKMCGEIRQSGGWNDDWCHEKKAFICETDFHRPLHYCPRGEKGWVLSSNNEKCLQVRLQRGTFQEMRDECREEGADLVTMSDKDTRNDVISLVTPTIDRNLRYWVGFKYVEAEYTYKWLEGGIPLDLSDIADLNNVHQLCGAFKFCEEWSSFCFTDRQCGFNHSAICEKPPSSREYQHPVLECPTGYVIVDITENHNKFICLQFEINEPKTWPNANADCSENGGELLDFVQYENDLDDIFKKNNLIGYTNQKFWSSSVNCQIYDFATRKFEATRCGHKRSYVCGHWGNIKNMTVDLKELTNIINERDCVVQITENKNISLVDVCHAGGTEIHSLNNNVTQIISISSQALVSVEMNLTKLKMEDHHTKCFLLQSEKSECCVEMVLSNPGFLKQPLQLTMEFPMDKISCLCPEAVKVTPETMDLLKNLTTILSPSQSTTNDSRTIQNKLCPCRCHSLKIDFNPSPEVLGQILFKIRKELKVDSNKLSSKRVKKISAEDNRYESRAIGYLGIALCLVPLCLLVAIDIIVLFQKRNRNIAPVKKSKSSRKA